MDTKKLHEIALNELREEEERSQVDAIKQDLRRKRKGVLYRLWFNLRFKKPIIKWEYR